MSALTFILFIIINEDSIVRYFALNLYIFTTIFNYSHLTDYK